MINADLLDFSNSNLLDSNIVGKATVDSRRRGYGKRYNQRYSNAVDPEMVQMGVKVGTDVISAVANRQPNVAKQAARGAKKEMKSFCGRKPLVKKKRQAWDKCVADYMKTKQPSVPPIESSQSYKTSEPTQENLPIKKDKGDAKILGMKQSIAIPVIMGVVAITGFFIYKKFFSKKGAVPLATTVGT